MRNDNVKYFIADGVSLIGLLNDRFPPADGSFAKDIRVKAGIKKVLANAAIDKLINGAYYCVVYYIDKKVEICSLYDKRLNFVKKGTLKTIANYLGYVDEMLDVSDIESKPELFLKVYKIANEGLHFVAPTPQELANLVVKDYKAGIPYAQALKAPKNPILAVCEHENIGRSKLASTLGVSVNMLEKALSRGVCTKNLLRKLKEHFDYV